MSWEQIKSSLGALGAVISLGIAVLEHLNVLYDHPYIAFVVASCGIAAYVTYVGSLIFRHVHEDVLWIFSPLAILVIFILSGMYQLWPSPPNTRIYVTDIDNLDSTGADATLQRKLFARLWIRNNKGTIKKAEINWGDREDWEPVDPLQLFYVVGPHEYKTPGKKKIQFRVTNSYGLSSFPSDEPPSKERNYWLINIEQQAR